MWITAYVLAILDSQAVFKQLTSAWKIDKAAITPMMCPYVYVLSVNISIARAVGVPVWNLLESVRM